MTFNFRVTAFKSVTFYNSETASHTNLIPNLFLIIVSPAKHENNVTLKLKVTRCSNVVGYSLDDFLDPKNIRNKFGIKFV